MAGFFGPDPVAAVVPAHPGFVAEADVMDIDEDLVAALPVPHLVSGVAGIVQNGSHCGVLLCWAVGEAMSVACRIGGRRAQDAVRGELLSDGVHALTGEELAEDPTHDRSGRRVRFKALGTNAGGGLGRVGMRAGLPLESWRVSDSWLKLL
ncbi:MAG: hypothetical protein WEF28_14625, partial [Acidimicrobiia bacterium]